MSTKEFIRDQVEKQYSSVTFEEFAELSAMENSLIILEIPCKDYTLTEIARIVESNNIHITSLQIIPHSDGEFFLVSLKLNTDDITALLRSFERFSYKVVYYSMREGVVTETQKNRLDELMYYLEM